MKQLGEINSKTGMVFYPLRSGESTNGIVGSVTTTSYGNGIMRLYPFYIYEDMTLDRIGCEVVTTPGGAGSVVRLVIYADDGNYAPGDLILDAGTVDTTATGNKNLTINQAVSAGVIWCGAVPQGSPSPNPTMRICSTMVGQTRYTSLSANQPRWCFSTTGITGAAPATAGTVLDSTQAAVVFIRRA